MLGLLYPDTVCIVQINMNERIICIELLACCSEQFYSIMWHPLFRHIMIFTYLYVCFLTLEEILPILTIQSSISLPVLIGPSTYYLFWTQFISPKHFLLYFYCQFFWSANSSQSLLPPLQIEPPNFIITITLKSAIVETIFRIRVP